MAIKRATKTVITKKEPTTEDLLLGKETKEETNKIINYEDKAICYQITNLKLNNNPIVICGNAVETFIGSKNSVARQKLISGEKVVFTLDTNGDEEYKIEVVE